MTEGIDHGDLTSLPPVMPNEFQRELAKLEAEAIELGGNTMTLSMVAGVQPRQIAMWLRGYETPAEDERLRVLTAVSNRLAEERANTQAAAEVNAGLDAAAQGKADTA